MKNLATLLFVVLSVSVFGQKIKLVSGNANVLKGQKSIQVEYKYNDMTVGKDGLTEKEYITKKKKEYDAKESGRGAKFEKSWFADRKDRFEPQFEELFTKYSSLTLSGTAKYSMIFHTVMTEPGWNVGVMRAPARINAVVTIVETANPGKVIAKYTIDNAPGRDAAGYDFDSGLRIQEAYAKSGKEIGKIINKIIED